MQAILVNYNHDPKDWWLECGFKPEDVTLYDRSDDGVQRVYAAKTYRTSNSGDVDFDKLSYLIANYDNLPDVFLWSKANIFKFITDPEFKDKMALNCFIPLLTKNHRVYDDKYGQVCFYRYGIYHERADSWFFNAGLDNAGRYNNWSDWCADFGIPQEAYIPFAPGGSYILTKERVHRYSKDFYERLRDTLPYAKHPVEAHCCERSYFYLWR